MADEEKACARRLHVPVWQLRDRLCKPGKRSFLLTIAHGFTAPGDECPWEWMQARPNYVKAIIEIFLASYITSETSTASHWQRAARRELLYDLLCFDGEGQCPLRRLVEGWNTDLAVLWRMCVLAGDL